MARGKDRTRRETAPLANNALLHHNRKRHSRSTFHGCSDVLEVPANRATRLEVKPGQRVDVVTLSSDVLNAVVASYVHPTITFD